MDKKKKGLRVICITEIVIFVISYIGNMIYIYRFKELYTPFYFLMAFTLFVLLVCIIGLIKPNILPGHMRNSILIILIASCFILQGLARGRLENAKIKEGVMLIEEKEQMDGKYYITVVDGNNEILFECKKEQYELVENNKTYSITYKIVDNDYNMEARLVDIK